MHTNKSDSGGFSPLLFLIALYGALVFFVMIWHRAMFDVEIWQNQALTEVKAHKDTADSLNKASSTLPYKDSLLVPTVYELISTEATINSLLEKTTLAEGQIERLQPMMKVLSEQVESTDIIWYKNDLLCEEIASHEAHSVSMSASLPIVTKEQLYINISSVMAGLPIRDLALHTTLLTSEHPNNAFRWLKSSSSHLQFKNQSY